MRVGVWFGGLEDLLSFQEGIDYRLEPLGVEREPEKISPVYIYYKIMGSNLSEAIQFRQTLCPAINLPVFTDKEDARDSLAAKKQLVRDVCLDRQIGEEEIPSGLGVKRMRQDLREIAGPVVEVVGKRLGGKQQERLTDYVAKFYHPERKVDLMRGFTTLGEFFKELQITAQKTGLKLSNNDQLLIFIRQLSERVLGQTKEPLTMFAVACPKFGEDDDYDRLEVGVSQTARTYLQSLPQITELLVKHKIPFKGVLLMNDTEDELLGGSFLRRLGLTPETYHARCQGNVIAIQEASAESSSHLKNLETALFTETFPQFKELVQRSEKRFYQLMQEDNDFYKTMVNTAKKRFERHQKILGGSSDFDKHLYLTLHYAAEYMVFGYLLRQLPILKGESFIVNYNSPNVIYFNSGELLSKAVRGEPNPEEINPVPVFQVKFY